MAIETQFTIRSISVEQALKEAEAKVDRSAKKMDTSLNSVGSGTKNIEQNLQNAAKGMDSVSKAGGKAGGIMKNLTESITGILSPIGLVSAAITGVIALVVNMYEKAKERMRALEEYARTRIKDTEKSLAEKQKEIMIERGYMERLIEISHYEKIDNATKEETIRIISLLASKYGDLGLSIDTTTGKVINLSSAMDKINSIQLREDIFDNDLLIKKNEGLALVQAEKLRQQLEPGSFSSEQEAVVETFSQRTNDDEIEELVRKKTREVFGETLEPFHPVVGRAPQGALRATRAENRYKRYFTTDPGVMWDFAQKENDKEMLDMVKNHRQLVELINSTNPREQNVEAYLMENEYLKKLMQAHNRVKVAEEMMNESKGNLELMVKWKKDREDLLEYIKVLRIGVKLSQQLRSYTTDPTHPLIIDHGKKAQNLFKQIKAAEQKRDASINKLYNTETANERATMSKGQLQEAYEIDNSNVLDYIESEKRELDALRQEYDAMTTSLKEYESYKNAMGDIEDRAKNAEYLELSNKITANKLAQVEAETRIAEAQTEQLGIQAKLNAVEEQQNKEQRDKITNQMKATMKGLFSNVLGDMKERTDSLALRGGYIGNTTNINPTQVNRQILNTVMTANNYLASIKQALSNVGRIR